jgi:hypothetical protein
MLGPLGAAAPIAPLTAAREDEPGVLLGLGGRALAALGGGT